LNIKMSKTLTTVLIAIFLASTVYFIIPAHAAAGSVSIINAADGSSNFNFTTAQKNVGDTFLINITLINGANISTWQIAIQWDNSLLNFVSMVLPADNIFWNKSAVQSPPDNSTPGLVVMGANVGAGQTPFFGSGRIAQLTLKIVSAPGPGQSVQSDIKFEGLGIDTFFLDPALGDLSGNYDWNPALYKYSSTQQAQVHDVAVTKVTPAGTSVINGSSLNIAVIVANTGNFAETFPVQVTANGTNVDANQTATNLASGASTTLTFVWNTTGWTLGDYQIKAFADLSGDPTPADNTVIYGIVHVVTAGAGHDVGILNIVPKNPAAIGQGYPLNVSVTLTNDGIGGFSETFDVKIFANGTQAAPTQTVSNLGPGQNATLVFVWNTTGWTVDNYTLSATADLTGDPTPADNNVTYGNIWVMFTGDLNNDGVVNMKDVAASVAYLQAHGFNSFAGYPYYNPYMDLDGSGRIDIRDLLIIILNFNKHI
jgi:hypothetical protein